MESEYIVVYKADLPKTDCASFELEKLLLFFVDISKRVSSMINLIGSLEILSNQKVVLGCHGHRSMVSYVMVW